MSTKPAAIPRGHRILLGLLQRNLLNTPLWTTRAKLHHEFVYWIEHTYNRRWRQRRLGLLTPVECELGFTHIQRQAAA